MHLFNEWTTYKCLTQDLHLYPPTSSSLHTMTHALLVHSLHCTSVLVHSFKKSYGTCRKPLKINLKLKALKHNF